MLGMAVSRHPSKWWGVRGSKKWFKWSINLICRFLRQGSNPTIIWVHVLHVHELNWKICFDDLYTFFFSFKGKLTTILLKFLKIFPPECWLCNLLFELYIEENKKTQKFLCVNLENDVKWKCSCVHA